MDDLWATFSELREERARSAVVGYIDSWELALGTPRQVNPPHRDPARPEVLGEESVSTFQVLGMDDYGLSALDQPSA
jgi:hypothetical protein